VPQAINSNTSSVDVLVAGTYTKSDAYPNIKYRIQLLKNTDGLTVTEVHGSLSAKINYSSKFSTISSITRLLFQLGVKSLKVILSILKYRHHTALYIPYPAIHVLWFISFLPSSLKPNRVIADVFISIYDTVVVDRKLLHVHGLAARLLLRIERRAFNSADVLVTDTPENSDYLSRLLGVQHEHFKSLPLSINENDFVPVSRAVKSDRPLSVLFVGTLVPLHNIGLLCQAIADLDQDTAATFTIIGDGQDAPIVEQFVANHSQESAVTCVWHRNWMDSPELADAVANADLCVGLLGSSGKSQRVWPFKNYVYMASGKALVTASSEVSQRLSAQSDVPAFFEVNAASADALASLLDQLIKDPSLIQPVATNAADFYQQHLSGRAIEDGLRSVITGE